MKNCGTGIPAPMLGAASDVACGTTQTATCTNPAPSCGGSACSGDARSVTGIKCSLGQACHNGSCALCSYTNRPSKPDSFSVTQGTCSLSDGLSVCDVTADFGSSNFSATNTALYDYQAQISGYSILSTLKLGVTPFVVGQFIARF